jgi:hypothetical protein
VSSGGNNGTLTNGPTFNSDNGGSIVFDGTNDYCSFNIDSSLITNAGEMTFNVWYKYTTSTQDTSLLEIGGNYQHWSLYWDFVAKTILTFSVTGSYGNRVQSTTNTRTGNWFNSCGTYSSASTKIYTNGFLEGTIANQTLLSQTGVKEGRIAADNGTVNYMGGNVAIVQIYNRALSATEVLQNYQSMLSRFVGENIVTNGLVFYVDAGYPTSYPTSGLTWYDVSGYNNNGTLTNGPTYSGASIVFDGTDDYVNFGNKNNLGSEPFTINTWFNHIPDGDYQGVITKGTGSGIGIGYRILVTPDGKAYFDVSDNVTSNTFISNTGVGSNTWVNVVLVRESSNTFKGYINGVLDKTETETVGSCTTSYDLRIGGQFDAPQYAFKGSISIASIYNRALSASEVLQNYNATKGRFGL